MRLLASAIFSMLLFGTMFAQNAPVWKPAPNDTLVSCRVQADHQIQFYVYAPEARKVLLGGTDIPNLGNNAAMTRRDDGVWQVTVGPVPPGAYRYNFNIDGVSVIDPRNPLTSQSNVNTWSLMYVDGADYMETRDVPHGAIAEVTYFSKSLNRFRRMHVYTPPGYESGKGKYPVLYLLHGAFDCDDSWTTVGRAGFILDNLIAEKKAKPMVVVMPAGHTGPFRFSMPGTTGDEFTRDFVNDIMPYAETHYRVFTDRNHRAMAGLSMGGGQTLTIGLTHMDQFAYWGVFSSGLFGIVGPNSAAIEETYKANLADSERLKKLKLVWVATGKEDFLLETSRATVDLLKKYGFPVKYQETAGAHTWIVWREYLHEFSQLLFK